MSALQIDVDPGTVRAQLARYDFKLFSQAAWHVIEPGEKLVWNYHLDAYCLLLEAMKAGDIRERLVIVPPGTTKSRFFAACFPAFVWIDEPDQKFLFISTNVDLARRDSAACRRIVESEWYRQTFRPTWQLRGDQNVVTWYETTQGGHRQCMGMESSTIGKKGHYVFVDDANDPDRQSLADQTHINDKFDKAIWTRVNDFVTGRRCVIGQRTGVNDLLGHVERKYRWRQLYIPEEFRPEKRAILTTDDGRELWRDPRTEPNELLRPKRFPPSLVADYKRRAKADWDCMFNGEPRDKEGTRFKRGWFRTWRRDGDWWILECPDRGNYKFLNSAIKHRFGVADGAASAKTSADHTVVSSFIVSPRNDLVWIGCKRFQAEIPEQPKMLEIEYRKHRHDWVGIEAVANNVALFQYAQRTTMNVKKFDPKSKDKLSRATPAMMFAEALRLFLPGEGESADFPTETILEELTAFTGDDKKDEHDDIVDTLAYAVKWLTQGENDELPRPNMKVGVGAIDFGYGAPASVRTGRTVLTVPRPGLPGQKSEPVMFPEFKRG